MRARWLILAAAVFTGAFIFVMVAGFMSGGGLILSLSTQAAAATCQTAPDPAPGAQAQGLDEDQAKHAAIIITVGQQLRIPQRGWVIAIAVAMQESKLHNVNHGDDWYWGGPGTSPSKGLFQQQPVYYPGVNVMDPAQSTAAFYQRLQKPVDYRGRPKAPWENRPLAQVAQEVQGSAFPAEYAKWETLAQKAVQDLAGVTVAASSCEQAGPVTGWRLPLPADKIHVPTAEHHNYPAVDLPLLPGETEPVFAMTAGTASPMDEFTVGADGQPGGCGHGVYVRGETGEWLYCHLSQQLVRSGQQVNPGDQIGVSGWTGGVRPVGPAGAHLHVQLSRAGKLTCIQPVVDALKAGLAPPAMDRLPHPGGNTCLKAWTDQGSR